MATEMDTISFGDGARKQGDDEGKGGVALHSAQFSEQTLNSLWTYAGEIAGEVISDVKRMMSYGEELFDHPNNHLCTQMVL